MLNCHCHCNCNCHCHQHHHRHRHRHRHRHQIVLMCCHRGKPSRENICFCLVFTESALLPIQSSICDVCGSVCMFVCVCVRAIGEKTLSKVVKGSGVGIANFPLQ